MHIFQRACERKLFNHLYLRLLSLCCDITVSAPLERGVDANRVSRDGPREIELEAGFQRIPMTTNSSETRKNTNLQDRAPSNPNISGISTVLDNPALSLLFKEFLDNIRCSENFAFYLEVTNFISYYDQIMSASPKLHTSHDMQAALRRE
jgi:hypothetical protein